MVSLYRFFATEIAFPFCKENRSVFAGNNWAVHLKIQGKWLNALDGTPGLFALFFSHASTKPSISKNPSPTP